jgi:SAM-dependent methyltransferase
LNALSVYESALRGGSASLVNQHGRHRALPIPLWAGDACGADEVLLEKCVGPTLDVGCGPGRMTAALTARGTATLGIDISALAVDLTNARGGLALQRSVFDDVPGEGRWSHLLLADGNIGIGGDPALLLRRCGQLLAAGGSILLDVDPPGSGVLVERVRIERDGHSSGWFRWCWVGAEVLPDLAVPAGLVVVRTWLAADRWQAQLVKKR